MMIGQEKDSAIVQNQTGSNKEENAGNSASIARVLDSEISRQIAELRQVADYYGPKDEMVWPRVTRAIFLLERLQGERAAAAT